MEAVAGMVEDGAAPIKKGDPVRMKTSLKRRNDVQENTRSKRSFAASITKRKPQVKFRKEPGTIPSTSANKSSVDIIDIDGEQLVHMSCLSITLLCREIEMHAARFHI